MMRTGLYGNFDSGRDAAFALAEARRNRDLPTTDQLERTTVDPNESLLKIRSLIAHVNANGHFDGYEGDDLIELVTGLDEWLSKGGFLPAAWAR